MKNTIGKVFTAGSSLSDFETTLKRFSLSPKGVSVIGSYSNEATPGMALTAEQMDATAREYVQLAATSGRYGVTHQIAVKPSALLSPELMKKLSSQNQRIDHLLDGEFRDIRDPLSTQVLKTKLEETGLAFSEDEFRRFLAQVLECDLHQGEPQLDFVDWRMKVYYP